MSGSSKQPRGELRTAQRWVRQSRRRAMAGAPLRIAMPLFLAAVVGGPPPRNADSGPPFGIGAEYLVELRSNFTDTYQAAFVEYAVCRDGFVARVAAAQPNHARGGNFACYLPTLQFSSLRGRFSGSNEHQPFSFTFDEPFGERPLFVHIAGNYPIEDMRFAAAFAHTSRYKLTEAPGQGPGFAVTAWPAAEGRAVAAARRK